MKADEETKTDGEPTIRVHGCGWQILQLEDPNIFVTSGRVELMLMDCGMQDNSLKKGDKPLTNSRADKGGKRWNEWLKCHLPKGEKKKGERRKKKQKMDNKMPQ